VQDDTEAASGQMAGKCTTQAMTGTGDKRKPDFSHSPVLP
jgi:hypothetical protein